MIVSAWNDLADQWSFYTVPADQAKVALDVELELVLIIPSEVLGCCYSHTHKPCTSSSVSIIFRIG